MSKLGQMEPGATAPPPENVNLAAALRLATVGIPVLPVSAKKKPLIKNWPVRSTQVRNKVIAYWQCHPTALPGINCGMAGLLVVDADRRGDVDGVIAFERLAEKNGLDLSKVPAIDTPGGGRHYFFRNRAERPLGNSTGGLPPRIEIRGAGGMVVAVGATLPDGRKYLATAGSPDLITAFENDRVPPVPRWLVDLIELTRSPAVREAIPVVVLGSRSVRPVTSKIQPASEGPSFGKRGKAAARKALFESAQSVMAATPGSRNSTLNAVAYRLGRFAAAGWLSEKAIINNLVQASHICGLAQDDGVDAVVATIRSGIDKGLVQGAPVLRDRVKRESVRFESPASERFDWHQAIMKTDGFGPTVYRLAGLMLHHYKKDQQCVDVASRFFAEMMGVDRTSVTRALDVLVHTGWLIPDGTGRDRASRFKLGMPVIQQ